MLLNLGMRGVREEKAIPLVPVEGPVPPPISVVIPLDIASKALQKVEREEVITRGERILLRADVVYVSVDSTSSDD